MGMKSAVLSFLKRKEEEPKSRERKIIMSPEDLEGICRDDVVSVIYTNMGTYGGLFYSRNGDEFVTVEPIHRTCSSHYIIKVLHKWGKDIMGNKTYTHENQDSIERGDEEYEKYKKLIIENRLIGEHEEIWEKE